MRIINQAGRLGLVTAAGVVDVERASGGTFNSDPQAIYERWDDFVSWARAAPADGAEPLDASITGPPVPRPGQVFAIGLNYRAHAQEAGLDLPDSPMVFTKFPASVTGPVGTIVLPPGSVDFEAELVAVIGRRAYQVPEAEAWAYVAGLTAGQDLSERELQLKPPAPQQYNLGKSFPGFAPTGPVLVTPDELDDPDDLELACTLSGEEMQKARTRDLVLFRPAARCLPVVGPAAGARRCHLHRDAVRHRLDPRTPAAAGRGRRTRDPHRGNRRDAPPLLLQPRTSLAPFTH